MKRWIFIIGCFVYPFFLVACSEGNNVTNDIRIDLDIPVSVQDSVLANIAGVCNDTMLQRAILLRNANKISQGKRAGVYVYSSKSMATYSDNPQKLAARLALLGLNDIYLSITQTGINGQDTKANTWIKKFNSYAHEYGLKVYALRFSNAQMYVDNDRVITEATNIKQYNQKVLPVERFDGASADLEPHILKENGSDTPDELNIYWDSSNNYGIGKSNDLLLQKTIQILTLAKNNLDTLPLNEAVIYNFQQNYNAGNLAYGATSQFLNACNYVMVMAYNNNKATIWNRADVVLKSVSEHPKSVSICVKTSVNTYNGGGDNTSLQPQGWDYLLETVSYLQTQASKYSSMRGVDFFEFEGLEQMWEKGIDNSSTSVVRNRINYKFHVFNNILEISELNSNSTIQISNVAGQIFLQQKYTAPLTQIDISTFPSGMYFVSISQNNTLETRKILHLPY